MKQRVGFFTCFYIEHVDIASVRPGDDELIVVGEDDGPGVHGPRLHGGDLGPGHRVPDDDHTVKTAAGHSPVEQK